MSTNTQPEELRFMTNEQVRSLARENQTPLYVLSLAMAAKQLETITSVPTKTPIVVRYAMKANGHPALLAMLQKRGVVVDVSSGYEAQHALEGGFKGSEILLNGQEFPHNIEYLIKEGVGFVATSLHQLEEYGKRYPNSEVAVRINPGVGSGTSRKVTTAGTSAAFGIWHEYIPQILDVATQYGLTISQMNTHIGCGTDPAEWMRVVDINLALLEKLADVQILNLGGGFKVGRMQNEPTVNMHDVLTQLDLKIQDFIHTSGRNIKHVEIEPGTYLSALTTAIIAEVIDIVDTGAHGYTFLRINTGMNDNLRPAMYGAQHPLVIVPKTETSQGTAEYVVVGHCCESSDVFTIAPGDAHELQPRLMQKAKIGDYIVIEGCGAYVSSMSAAGYNGFPRTPHVVLEEM